MARKKKEKKGFWAEFKAFISRGNVMDMAVGIIIGGAFTAIITALVNNILTPLLQMIPGMGDDGFGALQVVLRKAVIDPETNAVIRNAVVLDFGVVISAIISFLLTALMLFTIIKIVNSVNKSLQKAKEEMEAKLYGEEEEEEEAPKEEAPKAPTTEELLTQILDLMKADKAPATVEEAAKKEAAAEKPAEDK